MNEEIQSPEIMYVRYVRSFVEWWWEFIIFDLFTYVTEIKDQLKIEVHLK